MTDSTPVTAAPLMEFERLVLAPGEFVLLIPKGWRITEDQVRHCRATIPAPLQDRVLIVDGFDVKVGTIRDE